MRRGGSWRETVPACAVVLILLVVLGGPVPGGAASTPVTGAVDGSAPGQAPHGSTPLAQSDDPTIVPLQDQPEADATVTRIALDANGSATWTIEIRTRLTSADDVAEYEAFQERFRSNRTRYLENFEARMTGVVENANESLERSMTAGEFRASTRIEEAPQRWGVVTYSFRWDGFAATDGDHVVVGDVFGGDFFIEENSVLEVVVPDGYAVESVAPTQDDRSGAAVVWEGPATFGDGQPRVEASSGGDDGLPLWWLLVAIATLLVIVGLLVAWHRVGLDGLPGDAGTGSGSANDGTEAGAAPAADRAPLTDEDRVRELLVANDGRCKQSEIVEKLDWSKSKTSRVLSRMEEDDRIRKLRIGRENVIERTTD